MPKTKVQGSPGSAKMMILFILLAAILGSIFLFFVFSNKAPVKKSSADNVIKVATSFWPGQYWKEIADDKGWFKEAGLNVELVDTNADYFGGLQDVADGKIDVGEFPYFDFVKYSLEGSDLVGIINTDVSEGTNGIVAGPGIDRLEDLVGKRVGINKGTFSEYLLETALKEFKIDITKITLVEMVTEDAAKEIKEGNIDAVISWEPFMSQIAKDVSGKIIFDTSKIVGVDSTIETFHQSFVEKYPDQVQAYVNTWHRTTEYIKENPEEAYSIVARINKVTVQEVKDFATIDRTLDLRNNITSFSYTTGFNSLHGAVKRSNEFLIAKQLTTKRLDSTKVLNDSFIKAADKK